MFILFSNSYAFIRLFVLTGNIPKTIPYDKLHEYFLNGKTVKTADEYYDAITEGIKVSNIASKIVSEITDATTTDADGC